MVTISIIDQVGVLSALLGLWVLYYLCTRRKKEDDVMYVPPVQLHASFRAAGSKLLLTLNNFGKTQCYISEMVLEVDDDWSQSGPYGICLQCIRGDLIIDKSDAELQLRWHPFEMPPGEIILAVFDYEKVCVSMEQWNAFCNIILTYHTFLVRAVSGEAIVTLRVASNVDCKSTFLDLQNSITKLKTHTFSVSSFKGPIPYPFYLPDFYDTDCGFQPKWRDGSKTWRQVCHEMQLDIVDRFLKRNLSPHLLKILHVKEDMHEGLLNEELTVKELLLENHAAAPFGLNRIDIRDFMVALTQRRLADRRTGTSFTVFERIPVPIHEKADEIDHSMDYTR